MPTAPVVNSISFDKSSYTVGQLITATVNYTAGKSDLVQSFTGEVTDSLTGLTGQLVQSFTVADVVVDTTTPSASDAGSRTWTPISNSGGVAVFTATA